MIKSENGHELDTQIVAPHWLPGSNTTSNTAINLSYVYIQSNKLIIKDTVKYSLIPYLLAESLLKETTISFSAEGVHLLSPFLHLLVDLLVSLPPLTWCALKPIQ